MKAKDIRELFDSIPGNDFQERWSKTKSMSREKYEETGKDFEQSWKSASGRAFEVINRDFIVNKITGLTAQTKEVEIVSWKGLSHQKLDLQARLENPCTSAFFHLDNEPEIVCLSSNNPVLLIKIRTSLRDRVHMDLYWSSIYREKGVRYVMVTADDQLGTCNKPTHTRSIAECIYDRVYTVQDSGYCDRIRPLSMMDDDISEWLCR